MQRERDGFMIRPVIEVGEENSSGFGIELTITRRWSHFGFWTRGRAFDVYTGKMADDIRRVAAEINKPIIDLIPTLGDTFKSESLRHAEESLRYAKKIIEGGHAQDIQHALAMIPMTKGEQEIALALARDEKRVDEKCVVCKFRVLDCICSEIHSGG